MALTAAPTAPLLPPTVEAQDATGRLGHHRLLLAVAPYQPLPRAGSDAASLGAWEENGILAPQLGPNCNVKAPS